MTMWTQISVITVAESAGMRFSDLLWPLVSGLLLNATADLLEGAARCAHSCSFMEHRQELHFQC